MKTLKQIAAIFIILCAGNMYAQVNTDWVSRYNGPGNNNDMASKIATDDSGNVYVAGSSLGTGTQFDFITIKYNSIGSIVWLQRYNGPGNGNDLAKSMEIDASGNIYVGGYSYGGVTKKDYTVIKYNSNGVQLWVTRYNSTGNGEDHANSMTIDASGNTYLTGECQLNGAPADYLTVKINSSGIVQWFVKYNGSNNGVDVANSVGIDGSGNVFVTGYSNNIITQYDFATIKYNASGNLQWLVKYNGIYNDDDLAVCLYTDNSGSVCVAGNSESQGANGTHNDIVIIKYSSSGLIQWTSRYDGPGNYTDNVNFIKGDGAGNIYVTGSSFGTGTGSDYVTFKFDTWGAIQWVNRYTSELENHDIANALDVDASGNAYVTGQSFMSGTPSDYATIKYDPSGIEQWIERYNCSTNGMESATSIAVDTMGNVYVTGCYGGQ